MKSVLVIANNNAGRKQAIKNKKYVIKFLFKEHVKFQFISIEAIEEAKNYDFDTIFVMGGDGTINKVLPLLIERDATLGIIPSGTANLLASRLGLSQNVRKSLGVISRNIVKKVDLIKVDNMNSILRIGFGYDSDIICKTPQSLKNKFGYFAYFIAGILFGFRLKKKQYNLIIDDVLRPIEASCLIIANSPNMFKNIVSVSNESYLDDGIMEVFVMKTCNPILFFLEFLKIIFNIKRDTNFIQYIQAKKVVIKNKTVTTFHIDGEKVKMSSDININTEKQQIKVFCK